MAVRRAVGVVVVGLTVALIALVAVVGFYDMEFVVSKYIWIAADVVGSYVGLEVLLVVAAVRRVVVIVVVGPTVALGALVAVVSAYEVALAVGKYVGIVANVVGLSVGTEVALGVAVAVGRAVSVVVVGPLGKYVGIIADVVGLYVVRKSCSESWWQS